MMNQADRFRIFFRKPSIVYCVALPLLFGLACGTICFGAESEPAADKAPLFYLSFDESLNADQATGDGYVKTGKPGRTTQDGGKKGEALDLSALEQPSGYTTLTYRAEGNLSTQEGTVEFWYKPEFPRVPGADHPFVSYFLFDVPTTLRDLNNQIVRVGLSVSENGGQRRVWMFSGLTEQDGMPSTSAVVDWMPGEWHHVAMTWNAEEMFLFLDGVPVASIYSRGGLFGGNEETKASMVGVFGIGGAWGSSDGIAAGGLIDEFHIFGKALDAESLGQEGNKKQRSSH